MATTTAPLSSSPRLPSPPPFTEVQITPTPLSVPSSPTKVSSGAITPNSIRRIRPGTKSCYATSGAPLTSLTDLDSAFQLQEHLASLISFITNPPGSNSAFPLSRADCDRLATPPEGIEEALWCYELTRRLTRDLNTLIVALLNDKCTATTCPQMRASEWQYLCAVHDSPQSCCAIDYSTHTLDHAATMLTSTKYFPSRLSLHQSSVKHLASIFRRLYRIFAHAWFQHRHVFWEVEGEHGLYLFFKTVSDRYRLIPQDNLMLPPEAEGLKAKNGEPGGEESEEDESFDEWDRGTGTREHAEEVNEEDNEARGDSDEEENYSDESDSDEEILEDDDGIVGDDNTHIEGETKDRNMKRESPMVDDKLLSGQKDAENESMQRESSKDESSKGVEDGPFESTREDTKAGIARDHAVDVATENKSDELATNDDSKAKVDDKNEL